MKNGSLPPGFLPEKWESLSLLLYSSMSHK